MHVGDRVGTGAGAGDGNYVGVLVIIFTESEYLVCFQIKEIFSHLKIFL